MIGFISFPDVIMLYKMHTASFRVAEFSYNGDNRYHLSHIPDKNIFIIILKS